MKKARELTVAGRTYLVPDVVQGLPVFNSAQFTLSGERVYPRSQDKVAATTSSKPIPGQPRLPFEGRQVRLIPDVSAAALKQKQTKEIILWHCLRAIDNDLNHGNSHLLLETALEQLQSRFHFTESTAYRLILDAKGKVLDIDTSGHDRRTRIEIYGRKKIILGLGIEQITDSHFRTLEDSQFQGHGMRKAQLYEAINKPAEIKGATPKARDTIEEWTGVSRLQQWRYDKLTHTRRSPNHAFYWDEAEQKYMPAKQPIFSKCKGHREMNKRNGNTYHTKQVPDGTGMLRQIARELRARKKYEDSKGQASLHPTSPTLPAATLERLYYFRSSALVKAILKPTRICKEGYYLIPQSRRAIKGRQEWCYMNTA
ncbi:hypothetical protein ES703_23153 [subsurface metagenome]